MKLGTKLTREFTADAATLAKYAEASGDHNPIHLDREAARRAGFDDCVVHGMLIMGWAANVAAEIAGGAENLRKLKMRFKSPLYVGVRATVTAEVVDAAGEQVKLLVNVCDPSGLICASGNGIAIAEKFH